MDIHLPHSPADVPPDPTLINNLDDYASEYDDFEQDEWSQCYSIECQRREAVSELVQSLAGIEPAIDSLRSNLGPAQRLLELTTTVDEAILYARGNGGPANKGLNTSGDGSTTQSDEANDIGDDKPTDTDSAKQHQEDDLTEQQADTNEEPEQTAARYMPTREDVNILKALAAARKLLSQVDIAEASGHDRSVVKRRLPTLEAAEIVHRPQGLRKGYAILDSGRTLLDPN